MPVAQLPTCGQCGRWSTTAPNHGWADGLSAAAVSAPRQAIVYFWAGWCGPRRRFGESLASRQVADAMHQATLVKINADNYQQLVAEYEIAAIPAFLKLAAQGRVVANISSANWDEGPPENIAPVTHELVAGHYFDAH